MRAVNLAVKFLLEGAAFASFAVWGWQAAGGVGGLVLAVLLPLAAMTVWGLWCAPKSPRRLVTRWRVPLELGIFMLAALALAAAGHPALGVAMAVVSILNAVGLGLYRQWEH
ncbi:YrdB family protein [Nocardioides sp.]|uniref:YrdB family protein n=1 Tax=Nocardioides sp. TaxID=35761 RepID=UPI00356A6D81